MFEDRKSVGQKLAEYERGLRYSQICPVSGCGECGTCDRCRQRRVLLAILPKAGITPEELDACVPESDEPLFPEVMTAAKLLRDPC